jgi:hypothetical protein
MKTYSLRKDAGRLLAIAESLRWKLEDKQEELGTECDAEALLRNSMAVAEAGISRYAALAEAREKSPEAALFLEEAKLRCQLAIELLRRRVARSLGTLCRIMEDGDLTEVARLVIAVSS